MLATVIIVLGALCWVPWSEGFLQNAVQLHARLRRITALPAAKHHSKIPPLDKEPPMKILLLVEPTPFNYISGYSNRFKEMLKYLAKAGDDVRIVTPDKDKNPPTEFAGFPIISSRGWDIPSYKAVTCSFDIDRNIPKLIKEFKPDIIHCSSPSAVINPAVLWARYFEVPLVISYHTDLVGYGMSYVPLPGIVPFSNFLVRTYHKPADLVLCTSPQLRDTMVQQNIRRVDVWQKGINTQVFNPTFRNDDTRSIVSDGNPDSTLLLYVGRLGAEKKVHRMKEVLDKVPSARLVVVGTGPAEESLKRTFEGYPVHFTGQLVGDDLSKVFASCDIFTMTSDTETLGFVVMEAMASGLPVVSVAAGGVVDIVQDGETGYLAENNDDMVEFSQRVKSLVEDTEKRKALGAAALEWTGDWSWEAATSKLRNIQYRRAIALHKCRDERYRHVKDIEDALMKTNFSA